MQPKQQNNASTQNEGNSIAQVIAAYLPYWPLFLIFLILSAAGAVFYLHYATPKYEATATIIIKDEKKGDDDSKLMESLDLINTKKIVENEVEVLQSRTLMNSVVRKLHLYAPIYQKGLIKSISAYQVSPLVIEAASPDSLEETKDKVHLNYDLKKGTVTLDDSVKVTIGKWANTPYGTIRFIHNDNYVYDSTDKPFYCFFMPTKEATEDILDEMKVAASSKLSSVIDISYRDPIPKRGKDILNELLSFYSTDALTDKNTLAKNTLGFIEERLNVVKKDLDSIESKLQQYKTGRGAVDISKQGQVYLDNVSANDKRISDLNMQVGIMDQLEKSAKSPNSSNMLPTTLGVTDPALIQQMSNLSLLQMQYDKLKSTVAENNPILVSLKEQINQIKPAIVSNIEGQRRSLEKSRNELYATGGTFTSALSAIPQKERELVEISRDQAIKNEIYSFLLQKREESELSYASTIADSRVVNYADTSELPVSPKKLIVLIAAFVFALGCPVALVTGKEVLSPKILYRQEIESLTTIPIVGEISFNTSKEALVVEPGRRTVIAEEFRKVRVSLLSLGIDSKHKKILVTSSIGGEGKSFIAANLASSISLTGKKVVLVDLDLHNPGLGKFFGIKEQQGVSDYLIGRKDVEQIIYSIAGNQNLFYISSGTLQQDSSELLENGKIQQLIDHLNNDFDVVIIDAAPVVLITDAYLLSSICDATLYVVRHNFTPKMLIKRMDFNMEVNPIKNPGIIFNGVKTRGFFKNNYGYGYNYVYSYDNKKKKKLTSKSLFSKSA